MDAKNQNEIPEYVKNLPQAVQDFVYDGVWEERVVEIGKKYSLSETQIDILANNTLFVLIGLDTPDTFTNLMTSELGISKLLAGQIIEELETRVFEYALGRISNQEVQSSNKDSAVESQKLEVENKFEKITNTSMSRMPLDTGKVPRILEVRPETVPMVERPTADIAISVGSKSQSSVTQPIPKVPSYGSSTPFQSFDYKSSEKVLRSDVNHFSPLDSESQRSDLGSKIYKPISNTPPPTLNQTLRDALNIKKEDAPVGISRITYTPRPDPVPAPAPKQEPVEQPIPVPHFVAPPSNLPTELKPEPTKLVVEIPKPEKPEQKYAIDPYREPLE